MIFMHITLFLTTNTFVDKPVMLKMQVSYDLV